MNFEEQDDMLVRGDIESSPVVVVVPHCSENTPNDIRQRMSGEISDLDLNKYINYHVDDLFAKAPCVLVKPQYSRYVVNVNMSRLNESPSGAIMTKTHGKAIYRKELSAEEREERLSKFYDPFMTGLHALINRGKQIHDNLFVVCAISYQPIDTINGEVRGIDIIPGTANLRSLPKELEQAIEDAFKKGDFEVEKDAYGFDGGYIPWHFSGLHTKPCRYEGGKPPEFDNVQAVQLAFNRRLFMNEDTLEKTDGFQELRNYVNEVVGIVA